MATQYKNLINGKLIQTGEMCDVVNPSNEQVIGQVPACGAAELDQAVAAARAAFKTWSKTPIEERRATIQAVAKVIQDNHDELYRLLTAEQGKPYEQAKGEILGAAYMASSQATLELNDVVNEDTDQRLSRTRRVPVGVVGGIVPWNWRCRRLLQPCSLAAPSY
jgi:acyl-CoA reductase-like NAD-dependent aldehyde dehydrogenase